MNSSSHFIFSRNFYIYGYDTDFFRILSLPRLLCMLHETAGEHVNSLHVGWNDLHQMNQFWAISKITIVFNRFPNWRENVTVKTWTSDKRLVIYPRFYELLDDAGNSLLAASSDWVLLNTSGSLVRRNEIVDNVIPVFPNYQHPFNAKKLSSVLPDKDNLHFISTLISDLDMNDHVNNASYVRWIIDTYSHDFFSSFILKSLSINYVSQLKCGEKYCIVKDLTNPTNHFFTIYAENMKVVCNLSLEWASRD